MGNKSEKNRSNYGLALRLAWGGNPVNKGKRNLMQGYWLMPELMKKLLMLSKYYVKLIIAVVGFILCFACLKLGLSTTQVFLMIIGFAIVDVFLITPLIYMAVLPKPIGEYLKEINNLTAEEKEAYEKQACDNSLHRKLEFRYRTVPRDKDS